MARSSELRPSPGFARLIRPSTAALNWHPSPPRTTARDLPQLFGDLSRRRTTAARCRVSGVPTTPTKRGVRPWGCRGGGGEPRSGQTACGVRRCRPRDHTKPPRARISTVHEAGPRDAGACICRYPRIVVSLCLRYLSRRPMAGYARPASVGRLRCGCNRVMG